MIFYSNKKTFRTKKKKKINKQKKERKRNLFKIKSLGFTKELVFLKH